MIVVVAAYTSLKNEKDGMQQRISHIDKLAADKERVYIDISFRRYFSAVVKEMDLVKEYKLNFFVHFFQLMHLVRKAKLLYVHSAYNALKVMVFAPPGHVVFDAHGVVPEELTLQKRKYLSWIHGFAERWIIRRCDTLITVTRSMLEHFNRKYGVELERNDLVYPILPRDVGADGLVFYDDTHRQQDCVIYAGGTQVWQNVELMLAAVSKNKDFRYVFLSSDADFFTAELSERSVNNVFCSSVSAGEVKDFYLASNLGFVLRNDDLVNQVACPTKLVEYMNWGVVPIVLSPRIGDFNEMNFSFVTLENFISGRLPTFADMDRMRNSNRIAVNQLIASAVSSEEHLKELFSRALVDCNVH